jgi:hypothetical protein
MEESDWEFDISKHPRLAWSMLNSITMKERETLEQTEGEESDGEIEWQLNTPDYHETH